MNIQPYRRRAVPWGRVLIVVVVVLVVIVGSILWLLESQGPWITLLPVVLFTVLGVIIALFQWLFPVSSDSSPAPVSPFSHSQPQPDIPRIIVQMPHQTTEPVALIDKATSSYYSIEGVPPPTDPRTIQQREMAVKEIYVKLTQPDITAIVLTGIGGVGKSTLASLLYRYAEEQRRAGKGFFGAPALWLRVDSSAVTLVDIIGTIFHAMERPLPDVSSLAAHNQAALLFNTLNTVKDARLIVLDQFENLLDMQTGQASGDSPGIGELLDVLNSQACTCRLLFTSRLWPQGPHSYPPTYMQEYHVLGLTPEEGIELLQKLGLSASEQELLSAVQKCAGHAYALTLLASLLRNRGLSLSTFFKDSSYEQLWTGNVARNLLDHIYSQQLDEVQRQLLLGFSVYREPVPLQAACAVIDPDNRQSRAHIQAAVDALLLQHLLQPSGEGLYQLHAITIGYAHDHFSSAGEQENERALKAAHARAALYYRQYAGEHCPPRALRRKRSDIQPLEEAIWHYCQAEQWLEAYALMSKEGIYHDLMQWGYTAVLHELYELLFPLTKWPQQPARAARLYDEYGEICWQMGNIAEARTYYEQALALSRNTQDRREEGWALNNLGRLSADLGLKLEALPYYEEALQILREVRNLSGESNVLNNIGWVYSDIGLMEQAREKYEAALRIRRELKNRRGEARTLNSLGRIYENMGQFDEAQQMLEQALVICREINDRFGEGWTLNNLGRIYSHLKQRESALAYFEQSLRIRREIGSRRGEASTLNNLGILYAITGDSERASVYLNQALPIRREVGDRSGEGKTLNYLGLLYYDRGQYEQALTYLKEAFRIREETSHARRQVKSLVSIGRCYQALNQYDAAMACYLLAQERMAASQAGRDGISFIFHDDRVQQGLADLLAVLGEQEFASVQARVEPKLQQIVADLLRQAPGAHHI